MRATSMGALGAVAAVALAAAPASAAAAGRITDITSGSGQLRIVFTSTGLPSGTTVDPASVTVVADGTRLDATATPVTSAPAAVQRTTILVIDTSGSMKGEGIAGAKEAAKQFVDAVPADVRVGLVQFADTARVTVAPTTDHRKVESAIDGLTPAGETSLYDGVLLGLDTAGAKGVRSTLVLSDGADTRSKGKLPDVLSKVGASKVTVDTVAFKTPEATGEVLGRIARAGHGRAVPAARAGDIGAAFREAARTLSNQLVVTAKIPEPLAGRQVSVRVTALAAGVPIADEADVTLSTAPLPLDTEPPGPRPVEISTGLFDRDSVRWGALGLLFAGLLLILVVGLGSLVREEVPTGQVRRRLSLYTLTGRAAPERQATVTALGDSAVARSAVEFAGRMVQRRDLETRLAGELERAGVPLRPAEWLIIHTGTAIGLPVILLLLTAGRLLPALIGLVLGIAIPYGYLKVKAARRTNAFLAQMPDTLQLLAGSLQAGYSFPQAVDAVVREGAQPMATEFGRALIESRLGVPIEDALDHVAERMASRDFAWVVMAVRIQREVGGNLAEVLSNVANTMRDRERVRRQVKVLSAEGRLSALILGGLPPLFALYLVLVRPDYIKPLYTDPIGQLMLGVMAVLFGIGLYWLHRVVQVEV